MQGLLDHELMQRARNGDTEAFAALVRRHQTPLLNFFHRLGAGNDAEDLTQDVFLRVFRYRDRYVHNAKFTTFLYTLARHVWADRWRKHVRAERLRERAMHELPAATDGGVERTRNSLDVRQALNQLPDKLRMVLVMSLYQGLNYEEIAAALGIPVGTVKSRVFLAMRQLKEMRHERR